MGHGWKTIQTTEVSRKPCKCGQGYVIEYEYEEESDWHAHNRIGHRSKTECSNKECR